MRRRTREAIAVTGVVACLLTVTACTPEDAEAEQQPTSSASASATPSASAEPDSGDGEGVVLETRVGTRDIEYTVGPLVNDGDLAVLPITAVDVTRAPAGDPVNISVLWGGLHPGAHGVRLLDAENMTVEDSATADRALYTTGSLTVGQDDPLAMHVIFGARQAATVDVLVPFAGLVADVPVVDLDGLDDASELGTSVTAALEDLVTDPSAVTTHVAPLDTFQVSVDGAVDTRVTPEQVVINVSADVLFDVDQATITSGADAALTSAATQFSGYAGGELTVIGHTDDVGEEAYNQDLSVRRAQSVADHMGTLVDLSPYTVTVEGRGESELRAPGTSDTDRALNRRVELVFVPDVPAPPAPVATDFALPDSEGPTAPGGDGVTLTGQGDAQVHVALSEVRRRGQLLVGEVRIDHVAGTVSAPGEMFALGGIRSVRGDVAPSQMYSPVNLTLVAGDQRFSPVDYLPAGSEVGEPRRPVTEFNMREALPAGGTYVATVVWPLAAAGPAADQVTLDLFNPLADAAYRAIRPPFRLTDIPVTS